MKERPILFRGAMVRALLNGSKTQTRRVIDKPDRLEGLMLRGEEGEWCRFGRPGDRLWVRETWASAYLGGCWGTIFAADSSFVQGKRRHEKGPHFNADDRPRMKFKPSIFMPRWASRIMLELTDVRAQRLKDITSDDAIAEGATRREAGWSMDWSIVGEPAFDKKPLREEDISLGTARHAFGNYFAKINGKDAWDKNPWVWALTFRRVA